MITIKSGLFTSLFLCLIGTCIMPLYGGELDRIRHYSHPVFLGKNTYLVQRVIDDADYGKFAPQLLLCEKDTVFFLTCRLPDTPQENLKVKNKSLLILNEEDIFSYHYPTKTIQTYEQPDTSEKLAKLSWLDKNSFRFHSETWVIDDFGLYKSNSEPKEYLFLRNAYQYTVSADKKLILFTVISAADSRRLLLIFDIKSKRYLALEAGEIEQPEFACNTRFTYLREKKIIIFDVETKSKTETGISAQQVRYNTTNNTLYYTYNDALYAYNVLSKATTQLLSARINNFEVEKNGNYIVYDNSSGLSIYYLNDNYLLGNPVNITEKFDMYKISGQGILVLRTEFRDYKPQDLPPVRYASELVFWEKLDSYGHPQSVMLLNTAFEIYQGRLAPYKNSFDMLDNKIVFTYKNIKHGECKIVATDFEIRDNK